MENSETVEDGETTTQHGRRPTWTSVFSRNHLSHLKSLRFRSYHSSSFLLLRLPLFSWKSPLSSWIGNLSKPTEWLLALSVELTLQNSWWRATWARTLWEPVHSGRPGRPVSREQVPAASAYRVRLDWGWRIPEATREVLVFRPPPLSVCQVIETPLGSICALP